MPPRPLTSEALAELTAGLHKLARNLWWTWDEGAQEIFEELSPRGWQNLYHNAVAVLHEVSERELRARLEEHVFAERVRAVLRAFDLYMKERPTWGDLHAPSLQQRPVAYFSAEFGFHETLPIAAGGLGILAGDHAKAASDSGIGFVGISLFYREGYFQQAIDSNNWQTEYYTLLNPKNLPVEPVLDQTGKPLLCRVELGMDQVVFQVWRTNIGRVSVFLLDCNREENERHFRDLTLRVYGGDSTTRIMQEILLGVGGVRLLRALGIRPSVFHINEGHAAFLTLELVREKMEAGTSFQDALAQTGKECIFTTHTPVEAGHDRFSPELMDYSMHRFFARIPVPFPKLLELGRVNPENAGEPFCMTVLALKLSRSANAVSELHGRISRHMWHCLYPHKPVEQVPIGYVTNGIHLLTWMKGTVRRFWRRKLNGASHGAGGTSTPTPGLDWDACINSTEFWQRVADSEFISDEELWALRYRLRRELIEFARRRLLAHRQGRTQEDFIAFDRLLNPDALTIGFARRFATYKRAPLIFQQFEKVVQLARDPLRPVQFIFAGKAHPRDNEGKRYIQHILHLSRYSDLHGHLVFIENYDMHVARQMVSGSDVWLNTPRRPLEACGTSGMKAGSGGSLNLSILDGWWREGYDGTNGFGIGEDAHPDSVEEQDRADAANLYEVLTQQVIPLFYERDEKGIPRRWIQKVRRAMVTLVPQFTSRRMVREYTEKYYLGS
jgi:glycogen phosphorylase